MVKVNVKLGLTLPGQEQYSSFRADFGISEIDTEGDVEQQLKDALEAGDQATVAAEAGLAQQASNLSGLTLEGVGLGEQFAKFRANFSPLWKKLVARVEKLEGGDTHVGAGFDAELEKEEEAPAKKEKGKKTTKKTSRPKKE